MMSVRLRVLVVLAILATPLLAQEPKPAYLDSSQFGPSVSLSFKWRFHPGEIDGANPALDDSSWSTLDPRATPEPPVRVAWFRRHLQLAPELQGVQLAFTCFTRGRADVWIDGVRVARVNAKGSAIHGNGRDAFLMTLSRQRDHLLAVRYEYPDRASWFGGSGFLLYLGIASRVISERPAEVERLTLLFTLFTTVPLLLALLHLAFFAFYRRRRENLFYGLTMIGFAGIVYCDFRTSLSNSFAEMEFLSLAISPVVITAVFFLLLTYYAIRTPHIPRIWIAFLAGGIVLGTVSVLLPPYSNWGWQIFFAAVVIEIIRTERAGNVVKREGARILLWSLAVNGLFIVLQLLVGWGVIPPLPVRSLYLVGMIAFAVGMSLFLALDFARTSANLELKLEEVQTLSTRIIEQEREAHEQEMRATLIEAESSRRARELEQARELQLSMLPRTIPKVDGLEVAVAMATASEVGGDYYDFRVAADGSLVVAVGDATGHGVAAGTMVSAMKSLFTASAAERDLCEFLRESDRVLRAMAVPLQMCFSVARVTPDRVSFAAAAMPPLLVWRADRNEVEEVGSDGLPLGGRLNAIYSEASVALGSGDILLFATDGLAEMLDPSGTPLGFDGAAAALRDAACDSAQRVIERLLARAAAWRASREQNDDMTLVVVRVV